MTVLRHGELQARQSGIPLAPQHRIHAFRHCAATPSVLVAVGDIDWIQAAGNYVELHQGTTMQLMRSSMAELAARLDPARFVRISRSAIVQIDRIRELQPMFNGDFVVILKDGTQVAGSRRHREALDSILT